MKRYWIIAICCAVWTEITVCQEANLTFPEGLLIGAATASHQIEGAWNVSDKGVSSWDYFTHTRPEAIVDGTNGDIACDSYNKYEEDVQWLSDIGLDFYRFSINWARVLPNGFADTVSEDGIQYYKNLIEALTAKDITPVVCLYHWDHPQILEELGGWTNEMMAVWFGDYARVVFREFGPMVKTFITLNEPQVICTEGYNDTVKAPGKALQNVGVYQCVHNMLKAHATAYHIYDDEFRSTQQGEIGMAISANGYVRSENTTDASIEQFFQFYIGWLTHPIWVGDYPEIMKTRIAMISEQEGYPFSRLPTFSEEWIEKIKGSADYFGMNHYSSFMPTFDSDEELGIYNNDNGVIWGVDGNWPNAISAWLYVVPEGFGNILRMIRDKYGNPPVYILENGFSDTGELNDYERINYFYQYLTVLLKAIREDGCNVLRYTLWTLMDNFEWGVGFSERFGIVSVDITTPNRTRTAKLSTAWWQEVLRTRQLQPVPSSVNVP